MSGGGVRGGRAKRGGGPGLGEVIAVHAALPIRRFPGGALAGALSMALFAAGSSVSLMLVPWLYDKLQDRGNALRRDWGTRVAGGLLVLAAAWALWADAFHRFAEWCGLA